MSQFRVETWDDGRLRVNQAFARLLRRHGLVTFDAFMDIAGGEVARQVGVRVTRRIVLDGAQGEQAFYLKRHGVLPLKEYLKPLLRLAAPVHGAQNEWDAILRFQELGIPTMVPVAVGASGRRSFLVTQSLEDRMSLLDWVAERQVPEGKSNSVEGLPAAMIAGEVREAIRQVREGLAKEKP